MAARRHSGIIATSFVRDISPVIPMTQRLQYMPVSMFAMVMGLTGLTLAWEKAGESFTFGISIFHGLLTLSCLLFIVLLLLYSYKALRYRDALLREWGHPVKMSFVPAISISLLLFAIAFLSISPPLSRWLWVSGCFLHLLIALQVINSWLQQTKFEIHHMNPAWFIPAVGNVIVPLAGVPHGYAEVSWFFFSIGMGLWLVLLVIVFNRIIFHQPLPEKLLPTLFILIAPPAVGFLSYFKLVGSLDATAQVLYNFALFMTLLLFVQLRRFARLPFFLSWWAYTFPLAAMSVASMVMSSASGKAFYGYIGLVLLLLLSLLILLLLGKTGIAIWRGAVFAPED